MKTYNCTINKFNNNANYSKILDNIIADTLIKNNSYLFNTKNAENDLIDAMFDDLEKYYYIDNKSLKDCDFAKACKILANFGKKDTIKIPYKLNTIYRFGTTPVIFYQDEIQIGTDVYDYDMFDSFDFLKNLTEDKKKTIINISIKIKL